MIRELRLSLYLLIGILLGGVSVLACADTIPATATSTPGTAQSCIGSPLVCYPNSTAACASIPGHPDATPVTPSSLDTYCVNWQQAWGYAHARVACSDGSPADQNGLCWSYTCPTTGSYKMNPDGRTCTAPDCQSGKSVSSGYYDMGTSPRANFPGVTCSNGCLAVFSGSAPAVTALVGGVTHYYAQGGYDQSSSPCGAGTSSSMPAATSSLPPPSCGSNQDGGTVNGKLTCFDRSTGQPAQTSQPRIVDATVSQTTDSTTGNTTTKTTQNNPDGSTTVTKVITGPASGSSGSGSSGSSGTSGGTSGGGGFGPELSRQIVTTPAPSGQAAPADPNASTGGSITGPSTSGLYTPKYPDKLAGVWASRSAALSNTSIGRLIPGLAPNIGASGGCPSFSLPYGRVLGINVGGDLSPPCWLWTFISVCINVTALFLARALIFGG